MIDIVINADDFGYSDGICESILELLAIGAISGTSLMCAAIDAPERFKRYNASQLLGIAGVHLQLTGGRPLGGPKDVASLVDSAGAFRDPRSGPLPDVHEVEREWRRQIALASEALGGSPSHLDSHHGVHRIPEFFDLYVALAAELGVPIRGAAGDIGATMRRNCIPGSVALVREWSGSSQGAAELRAMTHETINANPTESVIEVITHPGFNDEYLSAVSSLSAAREIEHAALKELAGLGWPRIDGYRLAKHASFASEPS